MSDKFYNNNKPIGSVCHAPAIFKLTKGSDGNPLVQGKKVTSYSNSEEAAVQFTDIVPFSVEDMFKKMEEFTQKEKIGIHTQ